MIGRTLFWYIFKDLLRIFFMASGALAGIMSFGGLLRPLTHQGLEIAQVFKLINYFMPAMTTYSLPIAALFATTVVYGRLSADNEMTACRAGGLSHLTIALPAFVMGIIVAILSLCFLCFIVPAYTLKVEQTLYSNIAKLIAGKIQTGHEIRFGPVTIFSQQAYLPPEETLQAGQQVVVLSSPTIETIDRPYRFDRAYHVPKDFYTASQATIYVEQRGKGEERGTGKVYLTVKLENGMKFPRRFSGAVTGGVDTTEYGPLEIDSPIKEDTKFMDVWRLKRLYHKPEQGAKVKRILTEMVTRDQQAAYAYYVAQKLDAEGKMVWQFGGGESYVLSRETGAPYTIPRAEEVVIPSPPPVGLACGWATAQASSNLFTAAVGLPPIPALPVGTDAESHPVKFQRLLSGQVMSTFLAREAHLGVHPGAEPGTMRMGLELLGTVERTSAGEFGRRNLIQPPFTVPMTQEIERIGHRTVGDYVARHSDPADRQRIGRQVLELSNDILAESNSRVSFAISCLVLVMVGCALGMMFRSGNFLSAFAVSFVPALVTITLIVAGQRIAGNVPDDLKADVTKWSNPPLQLGLSLIWAGNSMNFLLAAVLLGRLQKK
jgi:hypothetical protein